MIENGQETVCSGEWSEIACLTTQAALSIDGNSLGLHAKMVAPSSVS